MPQFANILVAVDLSSKERFIAHEVPKTTLAAIAQAETLALADDSNVHLYFVLPERAKQLSHDREVLIAEGDTQKTVEDHAREVLASMTKGLNDRGIKASSSVDFGQSWVEVIHQVQRHNFDLLIAGTRNHGPLRSRLLGSTGRKLIRKCPCPVWIVKPDGVDRKAAPTDSILVAYDLTEVGDAALGLGCHIATSLNAPLHVLHAIDDSKSSVDPPDIKDVIERIRNQLAGFDYRGASIQVENGDADAAILDYIDAQSISQLVMGTIARSGLYGVVMGNTAEILLPFLPCSVIAIKPDDFVSPVDP